MKQPLTIIQTQKGEAHSSSLRMFELFVHSPCYILLLHKLCDFGEHFFFCRRTDIPTINKDKCTFRARTAIGFAPNLDLRVWSHFLQLGHNRFQSDMITLFAYADIVSHEFPFFAPLVVAVITLGRIRNNKSLFREVEVVNFNTV